MISHSKKIIYYPFVLFLIYLFCWNCMYLQLKKETKIIEYSTILVGYVTCNLSPLNSPIIVAAYSKQNEKRTIVHYASLHEPGPYELFVPEGEYYIIAFIDNNKNLIFDENEPLGQYIGSETVVTSSQSVIQDLDILISGSDSVKIELPFGIEIPPKETNKFHSTIPGAIADLNDVIYSDKYGKKGYWTPVEFFKEIGGNIYFLDDYDPTKIPILFVHGAAGSIQNWKTFINNIDHEKYQLWFYYYPSGVSIRSISYLLYWKLFNLQRKYQFNDLYITAHSMGGLVVRSFLIEWGYSFPSITHFISISTPWGGAISAEFGVEYSPVVIPAWIDMQPNGDFITSVFQKELPPTVSHYLLFGHRGSRNPLTSNNDKAVTIASQLDPRAQAEAKLIYGFNEDHLSILSSEMVLSQYNTILESIYTNKENEPGRKLRINFKFDAPKDLVTPHPRLLLRSTDDDQAETVIYLRNDDSGRELGPFPPGEYTASLIADAFVPIPVYMPITIQQDSILDITFSLVPRGNLVGFIVNTERNPNQAFTKRDPLSDIKITEITLRGNNLIRTLLPDEMTNKNQYDCYLSGRDCLIGPAFYFYKLPAGIYDLTIIAKGYESYLAKYEVQPGQSYKTIAIELKKITNN